MDKWLCCGSKVDDEDVATDCDNVNRQRSIFNLFRRRKSSRLGVNVTESTNLIKNLPNGNARSESNQSESTDHEENGDTDHLNDPIHIIEETKCYQRIEELNVTEETPETQVCNSKPHVEEKRKLAQIHTTAKPDDLKTEIFGGNLVLFDISHSLYISEHSESLRKDMELIHFSNINTNPLQSSFQYTTIPNAGDRDLNNIAVDYCRNVASCLKLDDEYVGVQIFARLAIDNFMESSSDESASTKRSQSPLAERPSIGPKKKKSKKKKNKKVAKVSDETNKAVGAVPVVLNEQQLASSKQIANKSQPAINLLNKGLDSATTSAPGTVLPSVNKIAQPTINKPLPVRQTSKEIKPQPSTSAVQNTSFECKAFKNSVKDGIIINKIIQIPNISWNCITRTGVPFYCALCKIEMKRSQVNAHMNSSPHQSHLQMCPVLGDFGCSLIRKVDTDRNHCAICNITLVETDTAVHCLSNAHRALFTLACCNASLVMDEAKRRGLENFKVVRIDKNNSSNTGKSTNTAPNVPKKTVYLAISVPIVPKKIANSANSVPNVPKNTANSVPNVPKKTSNSANSVPNVPKKTSNSTNSVPNVPKTANSVTNVPKKTSNSANSVPNVPKKTANSVPNVPKKTGNAAKSVPNMPKNTANSANSVDNAPKKTVYSTSNVANETTNRESNVTSTMACPNPKVSKIESIYKVGGEGVMVNQTVIVSNRSWSTFTGTSNKRYCNVCQTDTDGVNGFFHMIDGKHIETIRKYPILKEYGLNLVRKLPNEQFFCIICCSVIQNASKHVKSVNHRKNYSESVDKTTKILADPSKRRVKWNGF